MRKALFFLVFVVVFNHSAHSTPEDEESKCERAVVSFLPKMLESRSNFADLTPEEIATQVSRLSSEQQKNFPFELLELLDVEQLYAFIRSFPVNELLESGNSNQTIRIIRVLSTHLFSKLEAGKLDPNAKEFKVLIAIMLIVKALDFDKDFLTDEQVKSLPIEFIKAYGRHLLHILSDEQKELLSPEQKEAWGEHIFPSSNRLGSNGV